MLERQDNSYTWEEMQEGDLEKSPAQAQPHPLCPAQVAQSSLRGNPGMNIHEPSY